MSEENWFYAHGGQTIGPTDLEVIRSMVSMGQLGPSDMVWREGMADWQEVANIPELADAAGVAVATATAGNAPLGYYTPPNVNEMRYAGFWIRFAAYLIDYILTTFAAFVIGMILGFALGAIMASQNATTTQIELTAQFMGQIVGIIVGWLYYALMESSSKQATLGKIVVGLKVTDLNGNRISFGRATGRFFGKILSGIILLIGYLMVLWTEKKQTLHDMMAGTLVLQK
jgi:uncharacterized RDD family membrane protein YckC